MCVCVHAYMYVCVCACTYVYVCVYVHVRMYTYVCACVHACLCVGCVCAALLIDMHVSNGCVSQRMLVICIVGHTMWVFACVRLANISA